MIRTPAYACVFLASFLSAGVVRSDDAPLANSGTKIQGIRIASLVVPPLPMTPRPDIMTIAKCGSGQKECRVGVSSWCCAKDKTCVYDTGECK